MSTENNSDLLFKNSVKILTDLISFKTISGEDNTALIDYCDDILKKLGATSFRTYDDEKKRVNLFATLKAKSSNNKKPIILSGHTDVVPVSKGWSSDPFTATIKDDKLYGRGSCDMKGFIACTLAYAPIYSKSNLDRDIHFSFTFDEETACIGAPILIEELKRRNIKDGICIVGEPTNMKIIDAHKGCYEYTTHFRGLAGHSSAPHKGVSAVEYASKYVNKLMELRERLKEREPKDSIFDPPHSTLSIGGIFGGIAHNVIADKCHVNWETRPVVKEDGVFLNQEIDKYVNEVLLPDMKKIFPNASIEKNIIGEIIGFDRKSKSDACELISSLTGDNSRQVVSFGTEAGLFQEIGISTVVCGPGSIEQAHKIDEFIILDELKKRVKKDSIFDPPHSTLSIGGIKGGIAHNVIADKCSVEWETRPVVKDDGEFVTKEIDKYANEVLLPEMKKVFPDSYIKKEVIGEVVGFNRLDDSEACEFVSNITGDNSREVVSFGTEAGLFQELGISTVVCGPGSIEQAHKIDEFIELNEMKKCLKFLEGVKDKSVN